MTFKMYGLRTVNRDGTSYRGFVWPLVVDARVEATDWDPADRCGGGLHFLPWGCGNVSTCDLNDGATWLVIGTDDEVVEITSDGGGKSKTKSATVIFVGNRTDAIDRIRALGAAGKPHIFSTATAGEGGNATAGHGGNATAGDRGTATAGHGGTATAGDRGTIIIKRWDEKTKRYRLAVGYVGEGGIEAGTAYGVASGGRIIKAVTV